MADRGGTLLDRFTAALAAANERGDKGAADLHGYLGEHREDVAKVLALFDLDGRLSGGKPLPASCFNDFYKWTMHPVTVAAERAYGGIRCTFSVNIRDEQYRQDIYESAVGKSSPDLYNELVRTLRGLTERPFDRHLFEQCLEENKIPSWGPDTLDAVCGPVDEPRMLAQEFKADAADERANALERHSKAARHGARSGALATPESPGNVLVQVFIARDEKIQGDRVYIEATGWWHRVTWLETPMMQAVYDALFRHRMRKRLGIAPTAAGTWDDSQWYADWLVESLCRCARSVKTSKESGMKGALFTGRRTGGLPLMMLQGLFVQQAFRAADGTPLLLGTSSVTSRYLSISAGVAPDRVPRCAGTHAHELSMVLGSVVGDVDDQCGMPLSQIVGHLLYFYRSLPNGDVREGLRKNLMPMLPDTLGSRAFLKTAAKLKVPFGVHKGQPVLEVIGAGRQDSGSLQAFKDLMGEFNFAGAMMASEIEIAEDLLNASRIGFKLFGAGGFMGDSEKAWDSSKKNISMAVKVLRVYVRGELSEFTPTKTGETGDGGAIKEGKFEADGTLPAEALRRVRERAQRLAAAEPKVGDQELQDMLERTLRIFLPDAS